MVDKLRLLEYRMDGGSYKLHEGCELQFNPNPKQIQKQVSVQWRARHRGRTRLKKGLFRVRETMEFTLSGSCDSDMRKAIEFYSKQEAKFLIYRPGMYVEPIGILLTPKQGSSCENPTEEHVFVYFKEVSFTLTEGKIGWFDYNIKLERVNCADVEGYNENCEPA